MPRWPFYDFASARDRAAGTLELVAWCGDPEQGP
jgi:hypothetical protein